MHLETSSNLYGVTVNPFNRNLTSGGSSGGEGALVGLRGSCLGIGTDIGVSRVRLDLKMNLTWIRVAFVVPLQIAAYMASVRQVIDCQRMGGQQPCSVLNTSLQSSDH